MRTFNINLTERKTKDPLIESMVLSDYNLIKDLQFNHTLVDEMMVHYQKCLSELYSKLSNTNEVQWKALI